ncbi:MAG TPA: cation:proton antiporter [Bacteroidales bacterium]|nr:cation:proton antiporter [Bacteroidales bacterium]HPI69408.1 cation:proton antiporter [Bacteroidales bacterium]HPR73833.1 cation:proton antiporter [Bacteroidales bacterium]
MTHLLSISFKYDYFPLLVVMGLAWIIPMVLSILKMKRIPSVIAEIFIGYLAGRFLLVNITPESTNILEFLGLTGFIFLMFLSGLEIDMDQVRNSLPRGRIHYKGFRNNTMVIALLYFIITIILAFAGTLGLSRIVEIENNWYFTLIMCTTSVGIILPVLKNKGEASCAYGQTMIISAAVADILSIILFTFTAYILMNGFRIEITYLFLLFIFFYAFYRIGKRFSGLSVLKKISFQLSHAASQLSIRGTIFLLLIFVVISQYISNEVILLGAFLCGILMSLFLQRGRSLLMVKLDGLGYGFFIPVFFIMVGVKFDPSALKEFEYTLVPFLIILFLIVMAIKIIPSFLLVKQFGTRKALAAGFLLSSRLSLIIAASAIGLELGVISPGINASFIIMAVVTCFIGPVFYNYINKLERQPEGTTIIVGGSSKGVLLSRRLSIHGKPSVIIEADRKRYSEILSKGLMVYAMDGLDPETYKKLNLTNSGFVFVDTGSQETNIKICEMLRRDLDHEKIISMANSIRIEQELKRLDVQTIDVRRVMATTIETLIVRPTTYHALIETFENFSVEEIPITNPNIDRLKVKEIAFHKDAILIMARGNTGLFIPHGETCLRQGDILYVFGTDSALEDTREKLNKKNV